MKCRGLRIVVATLVSGLALAHAQVPTQEELLDASLEIQSAKAAVREVGFSLRGEDGKLAKKVDEVLDDSDAELMRLRRLETRRDKASSDEEKRTLNAELVSTLGEVRPKICAICLRYVRDTSSHIEDEPLHVNVRRAKMALEKACALLSGRLPSRDVGADFPTAEKARGPAYSVNRRALNTSPN